MYNVLYMHTGGDSAVCRVRDGDEQRPGRTDLSGSCLAGPGWDKHTDYQVGWAGTSTQTTRFTG